MEKQKAELKDKVVRIEIILLLGEPSDLLGNGTQRYIVEDSSNGVAPYARLLFHARVWRKLGSQRTRTVKVRSSFTRAFTFCPRKMAAAICVAVETHAAVENGKATYSW